MNKLGYALVKWWADFMSVQPYWLLYMKSDICYFMAYHVFRYRRKVTRENLLRSFPGAVPLSREPVKRTILRSPFWFLFRRCRPAW